MKAQRAKHDVIYGPPFDFHCRIPYADYEQDGKTLFGHADMGVHQNGILFGKKI
jgi:hypothetical protein